MYPSKDEGQRENSFERKSEITGVVVIDSYNKSSIWGDGVGRKSRNSRPA